MSSNLPIGVFDSGLGGLTVVKELLDVLPNEDLIYFGDIARLPYGNKSSETVRRFSVENTLFLSSKGVKLIIVACNTATSLALDYLASLFNIPFIGVIDPAIDMAVGGRPRRIAVIGTEATIRSGIYPEKIHRRSPGIKVKSVACPLFVPMIESGITSGHLAGEIIRDQLKDIIRFGPDVLLLGCTHYPIIERQIKKVIGRGVKVLSSSRAVALSTKAFLEDKGLSSTNRRKGRLRIYVSDLPYNFERLAGMFLGRPNIKVKKEDAYVLYQG